MDSSRVRGKRRMYCEHCKQEVSKSTFYRHYQQFFNPVSKRWDHKLTGDVPYDKPGAANDQAGLVDLDGKIIY